MKKEKETAKTVTTPEKIPFPQKNREPGAPRQQDREIPTPKESPRQPEREIDEE